MIKCNVKINGIISRAAQMRTDKDNKQLVSFPVSVVLPAKSGINKTVEVSVSMNGTSSDCSKYPAGQRVEMQGTLMLRKRGESLYFNFMADSVTLNPADAKDKIEGEMEFRGSLGNKGIIMKNDKKGNPFVVFSGFSTEKVGENFEFIWVRFVRFASEVEPFFVPKALLSIKGTLELQYFKDSLSISCRVSEVAPYQKTEKEAPF